MDGKGEIGFVCKTHLSASTNCDTVFQSISRAGLLSLELGLETEGYISFPDTKVRDTSRGDISAMF